MVVDLGSGLDSRELNRRTGRDVRRAFLDWSIGSPAQNLYILLLSSVFLREAQNKHAVLGFFVFLLLLPPLTNALLLILLLLVPL